MFVSYAREDVAHTRALVAAWQAMVDPGRLRVTSSAVGAPSVPARALLERGNVAFEAFDLLRLCLKCGDR